ncbi:hypothetical protein F0919_01930 [Taibaiella lutea]|uniref:Uncharacterized protein n=1 Tax=Taibaiella lutea TaxID=2608001 RepID=A0A5M6CTF2_9BACT|nr:hypothetical protein [Taibaiella lutea]KAA5536449.1 hypothetical protein F0919_01930 [Taibaiella lutea]
MKRIALVVSISILSSTSFGQTDKEKDSLVSEICKTVKKTKKMSDSAIIVFVYQKHLTPFLSNYPSDKREGISDAIYFRLQRNCWEFKDIINRRYSPKGDWQEVAEKPKTKLGKKACIHFLDYKKYQYIEASGDTVNLSIENGFWIDKFKDGSYSKLKFNWVTDCEFDIEFIESNNVTRKGYSKPGDKYRYQILEKAEHYYLISVEISGTNRYMTFKMYY